MNSKLSRPQIQTTNVATNNQLRRATIINPIQGIGSLSNLQMQNTCQGPPLSNQYIQSAGRMNGGTLHTSPPPLPPRHNTNLNRYGYAGYPGMNRYPGMNSYFSPLGPSRYSSGLYSNNLYSPFSNYRMPYGSYGNSNDEYNSFLQMAEESTRPAFESIESVVHIVNSISMMLESTYGAVHSSYSAILGVVDQFSRLKDHFAHVFSILTMLKGLHYLCLKVLYLLGLRKSNPSVEEAWQTAHKAAVSGNYPPNSKGSVWPFFMFLSLVLGAPWLMFKLLSRNAVKKPFDPRQWLNAEGKRIGAYAAYDFVATQPGELSFKAGETLILYPQDFEEIRTMNKKWILACNNKQETGLIPVNYLNGVRPTNPNNMFNSRPRSAISQMPPPTEGATHFYNGDLTTGVPNFGAMQSDANMDISKQNNDDLQNAIPNPSTSDVKSSPAYAHSNLPQSQNSNLPPVSHLKDTNSADISTLDPNLPSTSSINDSNLSDSSSLDTSQPSTSSVNDVDAANVPTLDSFKKLPNSS